MFSLIFRTIYIIFPIIWEYLLFIPRHLFVISSTLSSNEMFKFAETMPNIKKNIPHNLFCWIKMFINLNKCLTVFSDYSAQFISFFPIIWEYLPFYSELSFKVCSSKLEPNDNKSDNYRQRWRRWYWQTGRASWPPRSGNCPSRPSPHCRWPPCSCLQCNNIFLKKLKIKKLKKLKKLKN